MGNKPPESGSRSQLTRRLGVTIDTWAGVNKEADPSAIKDNELQEGINIRIMPNGAIRNRDGLSKAFATPLGDCVSMIADDEYDNFGTLYYDAPGDVTNDFHSADRDDVVTTVAEDVLPIMVGAANYSRRWAVVHKGELFLFSSNKLYSVDFVAGTLTLRLTVGSSATDDTIINSAVSWEDQLWLAASGGLVYSWAGEGHEAVIDGQTLGAVGTPGTTHGAYVCAYAGDLVYANTHVFRKRNGGSWDSIAMPGGVAEFIPMDLVVYKNKLYLLGLDTNGVSDRDPMILVFNNVALSLAHALSTTGSGSVGVAEGVSAGVSAFGYLFYAWMDASVGGGNRYIGRYDGTTWSDTHKNLTGQFTGDGDYLNRLVLANGNIYGGGPEDLSQKIFRSPGQNTAGEWVVVEDAPDTGSVALDLVVLPRKK